MHAISPQMMVWDPSTVGLPSPQTEVPQAQIFTSGFPNVLPQTYRIPSAMPQMYAGPAMTGAPDNQGVVWIQQQHIVSTDAGREDFDSGAAAFMAPGLLHNQVPMAAQSQGLIPIMMNVNGQRMIGQPQLALPGHPMPGNFFQVVDPGQTLVHPQNEGVQVLNLAGINQRMQNNIRLANGSYPGRMEPQHQQLRLPISTMQEKNAERAILTPRRRVGNAFTNCDNMTSWRRISDERSLSGSNTAIRRRSQSSDRDPNNKDSPDSSTGSPTPNKRVAPTPYPVINRFEVTSEYWRAPDTRILRKLVDIIEYYFSDECLTKNGYMLKQLSNNDGDGYISLRRVASLKRVKSQTRDIRTVAYAARQSAKLEMDEDGTMIRRKRPLPDSIEAPRFIRSVLAINLPKDLPSVEDVTSLFTPYGDLTQVRVLRPGKTLPPYLKDYTAWVPDLGTRVCAVVEFENQEEAQRACREINMQNRGQNSLRVALLKPGARIRRTLYRKYKDESAEVNGDKTESEVQKDDVDKMKEENVTSSTGRSRCSSESSDGSAHERLSKSTSGTKNNNINNNKISSQTPSRYHYDASGSGSDTGSDTDSVGRTPATYRIPVKSVHTDKKSSDTLKKCHNTADSGYSQSSSDERDSLIVSPTPQNSEAARESSPSFGKRASPVLKKYIDGVPVGVARQPKGPDAGSKGFNSEARQV